jgi:hypothetical protein
MSIDVLTTFRRGKECDLCQEVIKTGEDVFVGLRSYTLATPNDEGGPPITGVAFDWSDQRLIHSDCWFEMAGLVRRRYFQKKVLEDSDTWLTCWLFNEYAAEAEHQDGYAYWLNFPSYSDFKDDIRRYMEESGIPEDHDT